MTQSHTKVVAGPYKFRRNARRAEHEHTVLLAADALPGMPDWVRGFRVEKAGLFSWVLVGTSHRGH